MSVNTDRYVFDAERVSEWSNRVLKFINGDSDSIESLSKKVNTQLEVMTDPEVWSGASAVANYRDMMDTYVLLIQFSNAFADDFKVNIDAARDNAQMIEEANKGVNISIATAFGEVTVNGIPAPVEASIAEDRTVYDKNRIQEVVREFNGIMGTLGQIESVLRARLEELDGKNGWFEGTFANRLQEESIDNINKYCKPIVENLQKCVDNMQRRINNVIDADS